ncbi:MAG: bifunctional 3-deoxy-7-phosphoheptulonate synthase/chorismate mutase type II [Bacteroidales bacterium]|nr:bifunctional 3-deoxy-7-phosphoheptulonate synthase/chorismate mutase type II [Bacteroidales bacterium]
MNNYNDILSIQNWFPQLNDKNNILIAGPCSAETEEQVLNTAIAISKIPEAEIFRAGIWKPRTRPGSFEGVGEIGLEWLKKVKEKTGLLTCVEVATVEHIKLCKEHKDSVDILWIGARTTVNPFSVQELADVLLNCNKPIMIKNPVNPDLNLWIGAIERIYKSGIKKIAAVHRGFSAFEPSKLRNIPKWEIPIELKIQFPDLSIINDPSHIAGKPEYIAEIAQYALDLNMNGLMIETHINPKAALSDAKQQITPKELSELLKKLEYRLPENDNPNFNNNLEQFRYKIDSIDHQILELLSYRMDIVENIAKYKAENNVSILQLKRWREIISNRLKFADEHNLDKDFVKTLLELVHTESIKKQKRIFNLKKES